MNKQINYLPMNNKKLDNFTLNAFKKIQKTKKENLILEDQKDFQNWICYRNNLEKINIFINNIKEVLKNDNYKIVDEKGFKNMIASIIYKNSV